MNSPSGSAWAKVTASSRCIRCFRAVVADWATSWGPARAAIINPLLMGGAVSMMKCFMSLFSWSVLFLPPVFLPPVCLLVLDDGA